MLSVLLLCIFLREYYPYGYAQQIDWEDLLNLTMTLGARKKERKYQAHVGEQLRSQRELSALNNFPSSISSTNLLMGTIMIVYPNGDTPVLSVYKSAYPHF